MPSDRPHTPQSPSQVVFSSADLPPKPVSPKTSYSLPTPAHSINGSMSSISDIALEAALHDDTSNKRKRSIEDDEEHGDRNQKKLHVEDSRLSIEDLHLDVGDKYLLCKTPHVRARPDTTQDLFDLYGFNDLAKSVARRNDSNPDGKNVRKTYKSVFRGLSGAFDVTKKEMNAPDTLFAMMQWPADEWNAQMVRGKDVTKGLSGLSVATMGKAFKMAKGPIPKAAWNSSVLGDIAASVALTRPVAAAARPVTKATGANGVPVKAPITHMSNVGGLKRPTTKDLHRPQRTGKKRNYEDSSFEGYGDGYVDDEVRDAGYSENDDGSRKKLKKSATSHANFQQGPMRQQSYGPGMVGA